MAIYMWREQPDELCFTANTANSTVQLTQTWTPTTVELETSTNGTVWTDYTIWNTITLSSIWDKVYWRNKSETPTGFSSWASKYYKFVMSWSIAASWDVNFLLCKNSTTSLAWNYCFQRLFQNCSSLTSTPSLPATALSTYCYQFMFSWCTSLTKITNLPATSLAWYCYNSMFAGCSNLMEVVSLPALEVYSYSYTSMFVNCTKIKLSETQDSDYTQPYRIPTTWTWTFYSDAVTSMFGGTWWTFTNDPVKNHTYYLHKDNTIV